MKLVLIDTSVASDNNIIVGQDHIDECLSAYTKDHGNLTNEGLARKNLVTELMKTEEEILSGFLMIELPSEWDNGQLHKLKISVTPSDPGDSIFKRLVLKFQDKVKIEVCLKWREYGQMVDFASVEGMTIDPKWFFCAGDLDTDGDLDFLQFLLDTSTTMDILLVADIQIDVTISKRPSIAQKVLERGAYSDLTISTGNGAEFKVLKAFLSASSPVLEAMLGSVTEESQTGRVDMSDLSEEGLGAFLRYVYYEDLEEPKENMQVAYELLYAGHKYDVRGLEAEMKTILLNKKNEDIGQEWAFKIFMFTRNVDSAVEVKAKAIQVLSMQDDHPYDVSSLEQVIESFLAVTDDDDMDLAVALKMYMFIRTIESAVELKNKAIHVLKAKWDELESLQEYKDLFENASSSKAAIMDLCRDLAKTA